MTGGFDANVPMRKPRTKIARVISELTATPAGGEERRVERAEFEPATHAATPAEEPVIERVYGAFRAARDPEPARAPDTAPVYTPPPARPAAALSRKPIAASPVAGSREQIAKLRERLAATAHPRTGAAEPQRTAAAVREIVDGMRERIETSARERSELAAALETARTALAQANADLSRERRTREGLAAQAEERRRIFLEKTDPQARAYKDFVFHACGGGERLETALEGMRRMVADPDYRLQRLMFTKGLETTKIGRAHV